MSLKRTLVAKDGTVEVQHPHLYAGGKYRVLIEVDTISEVEELFASGKAISLRMSGPSKQKPVLVRPDK